MSKNNIITWIILILLTIISGLVSSLIASYVVPLILILAVLKFIGVSFNFMELKKAHLAWKVLLIGYLTIFISVILILTL